MDQVNIYDTNESDVTVLSYGGGVQSVAMCVLAATGRLPSPDHIVFADTGREIPSTLEYRATVMDPYLEKDRGRKPWPKRFPLIDLMLTRADCLDIIEQAGLPAPRKSRCWMCPHQSNEEWREVRDQYPELFAEAVAMDEEVRAADERGGVYLHQSRTPLATADLDVRDRGVVGGDACGFGRCWL